MAADDANQPQPGEQQQPQQEEEEQQKGGEEVNEDAEEDELPSSSSSSSSESESDSESSDEDGTAYYDDTDDEEKDDNNPESNIQRFTKVLDSSYMKKRLEQQERDYNYHEDLFDFPKDPEQWREEDLRELWADAPLGMTKPGWDPFWADEEDWEVVREEIKEGRDPPIAPFYLPYRKYYPAIPDNHHDISNPKSVIEELDRIEEFLRWVSYIFPDGSTWVHPSPFSFSWSLFENSMAHSGLAQDCYDLRNSVMLFFFFGLKTTDYHSSLLNCDSSHFFIFFKCKPKREM